MAQLHSLSATAILLSTTPHPPCSRSSFLPTPLSLFPSSGTVLESLHLKVSEHEWRMRTALCQSNAKIVCLGGDEKAREAARKSLESALGGKKELFNKWDQEIQKRESGSVGGGSGGRSGGGTIQQDGDSWEEAMQIAFAFMGLVVVWLLITNGEAFVAFIVNGILFALRGFKRRSRSRRKEPLQTVTRSSGSNDTYVISKWQGY